MGCWDPTEINETARGTISTVSFQWLLFDFGQRAAIVEAAKQASVISNIGFHCGAPATDLQRELGRFTQMPRLARASVPQLSR